MIDALRWFVVHTKPLAEWQANVNLRQQGIETFCPYLIKTRAHGRRIEGVVRGYFPRYLFAGLPEGHSIRPINSTFGVSTVVYLAGAPLNVPVAVIDDLKSRCDLDGRVIDDIRKPAPQWRIGEIVKLVDGPFTGFLAEIARLDGSEQIRVWVDLFGRKVEALVPATGIAA